MCDRAIRENVFALVSVVALILIAAVVLNAWFAGFFW